MERVLQMIRFFSVSLAFIDLFFLVWSMEIWGPWADCDNLPILDSTKRVDDKTTPA